MTVRLLIAALALAAGIRAQNTSIIVTGSVERDTPGEDATIPPDLRIAIECHGEAFEGRGTSQSGQFRFPIAPEPLTVAANTLCSAEAVLFGWNSSILRFPIRPGLGMVNIGTITIRHGAGGDAQESHENAGKTISATSLRAPPHAVKLFERGLHSLQQGKFAEAAKDFESANKIYPDYAESWLNLGRARMATKAMDSAREAFVRAAQLDPQLAEPPEELGLLAAGQNDLASAARYLDESIRLDPGRSYRACYSDALVNLMLKRYDVAESSARAALRFGDSGAQARANYVLGIALLAKGANIEAKQRLRRYLELSPNAPERGQIEKELGLAK